jgi:hypothetical protein
MSIEIWQFPSAVTKGRLVEALRALGFESGENLFWPGLPGTVSLFWSQPEDFVSTSGVDASVFPLDDQGRMAWNTTTEWALRTRTSTWASSFDKEFQNNVVRSIRKSFGGRFYNDHHGHNRYIIIAKVKSTPAGRGIFAVLSRVSEELEALKHALPEEMIRALMTPRGEIPDDTDATGVLRFSKQLDPSRVVYNALVPFLVAAIEHFFLESFEILLKYDVSARGILQEQNRRLSFAEAIPIERDELTIERVASGWYSFQNLDSIQKAFKEVFAIDVWKAIRRRRKIRGKLPLLSTALKNLIGARHGVVHHFSLDRNLDREGFIDLLHLVRALLEIMAKEIERKLGVTLGPG